jgi:hypothetical protein
MLEIGKVVASIKVKPAKMGIDKVLCADLSLAEIDKPFSLSLEIFKRLYLNYYSRY